jgi:carboxymethylenebutenolidase
MSAISLRTRHGRIGGWEAKPHREPRGGLVVIQEIFGVNPHMRQQADRLASHGFHCVAPALFDLIHPNAELGYDEAGIAQGRELAEKLGFNGALDGVRAAFDYLDGLGMRVASIGFCWGGTVAFLANTRFGLPGVSYYGGRTVPFLHERLKAPMLFHFGELDTLIPPEDVAKHKEALPHSEMHVWPGAGHGFNCDQRADYNAEVANQAMARTLTFLQRLFRTG